MSLVCKSVITNFFHERGGKMEKINSREGNIRVRKAFDSQIKKSPLECLVKDWFFKTRQYTR